MVVKKMALLFWAGFFLGVIFASVIFRLLVVPYLQDAKSNFGIFERCIEKNAPMLVDHCGKEFADSLRAK